MHNIRIYILFALISAMAAADFFDHAFRKHGHKLLNSESSSINKDSSKIQKRVGQSVRLLPPVFLPKQNNIINELRLPCITYG